MINLELVYTQVMLEADCTLQEAKNTVNGIRKTRKLDYLSLVDAAVKELSKDEVPFKILPIPDWSNKWR